jgi:hypothetical protein
MVGKVASNNILLVGPSGTEHSRPHHCLGNLATGSFQSHSSRRQMSDIVIVLIGCGDAAWLVATRLSTANCKPLAFLGSTTPRRSTRGTNLRILRKWDIIIGNPCIKNKNTIPNNNKKA